MNRGGGSDNSIERAIQMKYRYGNSWEKYPILNGEIWRERQTNSAVSVYDITTGIPHWMKLAEMIYCDPPWNLGNLNTFYTKAGRDDYKDRFSDFYNSLFLCIADVSASACYLEIGKQNLPVFKTALKSIYPVVQVWPIFYYRKNPCFLLRGGHTLQSFDFTSLDDAKIPEQAILAESATVVADFCTGQGLTAVAAYRHKKTFLGTELNARRLAVAIDRVNKLGGQYESTVSKGYFNCAD